MKKIEDIQYSWFKKKFFELSGIDLDGYKDMYLNRRIVSYCQKMGINNFVKLYNLIKNDNSEMENFKNFLTVNTSYFFRDIDKWENLKVNYLPLLLSKNKTLKIWSAGTSTGCELYTIVILLEEYKKLHNVSYSILATDVDALALNKAKDGIYTPYELKYVKEDFLNEYFTKYEKNFKIKEKLKKNITFKIHNLHSNEFPSCFDIITCRNVVIYFSDNEKEKLYKKFHASLNFNGILFIGGSEIIFNCEAIGFKKLSMCFYQKV